MTPDQSQRLLAIKDKVTQYFTKGHWQELGLVTGCDALINGHYRLLRSLDFGDDDYKGNVIEVLREMVERKPFTLDQIESYVATTFPQQGEYISAEPSPRVITFAPNVFRVPEGGVDNGLVALMMPFTREFDDVSTAVKNACAHAGLRCLRVDDIWSQTVIVQEIFDLIFRARIVVVDFTDKNPNVMYETGIAHTLGKHVVPIAQSIDHVPFDLRHHKVLTYLRNAEGLGYMVRSLTQRLDVLRA